MVLTGLLTAEDHSAWIMTPSETIAILYAVMFFIIPFYVFEVSHDPKA